MGKTVEQALLEVMEEEELAALRAQQVYTLEVIDRHGLTGISLPLMSHGHVVLENLECIYMYFMPKACTCTCKFYVVTYMYM